ncbi:MAG: hypothetical protein ACREEO_09500 [Phenylobacterium sp.]
MMLKTLLTAAAATALLAGAAQAGEGAKKAKPADAAATQMKDQKGKAMTTPGADASATATTPDTSVNPAPDAAAMPPPSSDAAAMPPASSDASAEGVPASATVSANAVTNGPVADTPENRAKYKPLSRAGRQTAARGN